MLFDVDNFSEVVSSHISAVATKGDWLVVLFKNGSIYRYPEAASYYSDLVSASSVGKYFHEEIRDLSCERLSGGLWPDGD